MRRKKHPQNIGRVLLFHAVALAATLQTNTVIANLCGNTDTRISTSIKEVGRLRYSNNTFAESCTAWLVSNGAFITAGHCFDGGVSLQQPDPILLEFDVPKSRCSGEMVFSSNKNIFVVDNDSVVFSDSVNNLGDTLDWAIFNILPQADGSLPAAMREGKFFRLSNKVYSEGTFARLTGYGIAFSSGNACPGKKNRTQKTGVGKITEWDPTDDDSVWYTIDATSNNSGSPVYIHDSSNNINFSIAIHVGGTCNLPGLPGNAGTPVLSEEFVDAMNTLNRNTIFIDSAGPDSGASNGTIFAPYSTISDGVNAASSGNILNIAAGTYTEDLISLSKAITIRMPVGDATVTPP